MGNDLNWSVNWSIFSGVILFKTDRTLLYTFCKKDHNKQNIVQQYCLVQLFHHQAKIKVYGDEYRSIHNNHFINI